MQAAICFFWDNFLSETETAISESQHTRRICFFELVAGGRGIEKLICRNWPLFAGNGIGRHGHSKKRSLMNFYATA